MKLHSKRVKTFETTLETSVLGPTIKPGREPRPILVTVTKWLEEIRLRRGPYGKLHSKRVKKTSSGEPDCCGTDLDGFSRLCCR